MGCGPMRIAPLPRAAAMIITTMGATVVPPMITLTIMPMVTRDTIMLTAMIAAVLPLQPLMILLR